MAWRFEPGEELRSAFCRAAKEEIGKVRAGLTEGTDQAQAIHEARQSFKRLRALMRLARPTLGARFAAENRRWRDAGRQLSGSRDRTVLMQTFENAVTELDLHLPARAVGWMRKRVGQSSAAPSAYDTDAQVEQVLCVVEAADQEVDALDWPEDSKTLAAGLRHGQTRLRRSWKEAKNKRTPEARHEWRKRVKDQAAQLRLFRNIAPHEMEELRGDAKDTAEHLGEEHDLWMLAECLAAESVPQSVEEARDNLLAAIKKRRARLRRLAFERGKRFSARNARGFAAELCDAWDNAAKRAGRKSRRSRLRVSGAEEPAATSQAG